MVRQPECGELPERGGGGGPLLSVRADFEHYTNTTNTTAQPYKYQGIQLEKHFGLEMYETAFRALDPQLGRFNSVDPKAELVYSMSPYVSMGNNPALNVDPLGDIFKIGNAKENREAEVKDVRGLAIDAKGKDNSQYVKIANDGTVSLDFGDMSKEDQTALIASDKGLTLINDLIHGQDADGNDLTWEYQAGETLTTEEGHNISKTPGGVFSLSRTPKNANGGLKSDRDMLTIPKGLDGLVYIAPATFCGMEAGETETVSNGEYVRRSSIVYHELRENWFRTSQGLPYRRTTTDPKYQYYPSLGYYQGMDGAHNRSVIMEDGNYGNSNPGGFGQMFETK